MGSTAILMSTASPALPLPPPTLHPPVALSALRLLNTRAWRGIQELPPDDPNSFWVIAGYHGIPLAPFDPDQPHLGPPFAWWGGFCHHGNVLFPMWHRAYVKRLENALRTKVSELEEARTRRDSCRAVGLARGSTERLPPVAC